MLTALHRASRLAQRSRVSKPRSTDGGNRWTAASKGIDRREFPRTPNQDLYKAFTLDEHQPSRLVLGGQSVWQTLDSGATGRALATRGFQREPTSPPWRLRRRNERLSMPPLHMVVSGLPLTAGPTGWNAIKVYPSRLATRRWTSRSTRHIQTRYSSK